MDIDEFSKDELSICHVTGMMLGTAGRGGQGGTQSEEGIVPDL